MAKKGAMLKKLTMQLIKVAVEIFRLPKYFFVGWAAIVNPLLIIVSIWLIVDFGIQIPKQMGVLLGQLIIISIVYLPVLSFFLFRKGRKLHGLVVLLSFIIYLLMVIFTYPFYEIQKSNYEKKELMKSPKIFNSVGKDLAIFCQNIDRPIKCVSFSDSSTKVILPDSIKQFNPMYGYISNSETSIEMHGGFDHFGYLLRRVDFEQRSGKYSWNLYYYEEGKRLLLKSFVTDRVLGNGSTGDTGGPGSDLCLTFENGGN